MDHTTKSLGLNLSVATAIRIVNAALRATMKGSCASRVIASRMYAGKQKTPVALGDRGF